MEILLNNKKCYVKWGYEDQLVTTYHGPESRRITKCTFVVRDEATDEVGEISEYAICHPNDLYTKEEGRKRSLAKLMNTLQLPKEERKTIWEVYKGRIQQPTLLSILEKVLSESGAEISVIEISLDNNGEAKTED